MTFALVGASDEEHGGFKLEDLADNIATALDKGRWVKLGFYDFGYRQSVQFWPTGIADAEGFQHTSMRAFNGEIGAPSVEPKFPACLIIAQHAGKTEAAITWSIAGLPSTGAAES